MARSTIDAGRRRLLGAAALPLLGAAGIAPLRAAPRFTAYPFPLGVASGDPSSTGIVLWTRLAPQPLLPDGGMPHAAVEIGWEIAEDERFKRGLMHGRAIAFAELGHTVHVEVEGLQSGRDYFYRFTLDDERSAVGRARTLPAPGALQPVRLGVVGCQRYEYAHFHALADLARDAPDFVYCYGDFIYEYRSALRAQDPGRVARELPIAVDECVSLDDYRLRYAIYRLDTNLQAAARCAPWIASYDDHEVENGWIADLKQDERPSEVLLLRRAAALQAWYENQPVRRSALPRGPDLRAYRRFEVGGLMRFSTLDTRLFRSGRFCDGKLTSACSPADADARHTMLGAAQEAWLADGLKERAAPVWTVLAQQILMAQAHAVPKSDKWDRTPLARQRLMDLLADSRAPNPIVLSGDLHYGVAADLKRDWRNLESPTVGSEILGYAVGSTAPSGASDAFFATLKQENPHIKLASRERGWTRHTVDTKRWRAEFRAVAEPMRAESAVETVAAVSVEAGRPGLRVE
ncbi:MAG TPA: alkaline phosphatase D family protein [Methylibium sp.]|uniref:alkaline phosphatase D family protein n=1 Tax=Methylibium sp. TaxID=2067992 RepID=UPI002DBBE17C|nr:alkaline phosphatase D family protein [Methylibium sp.]HEU4459603.1 alkaline phosphatase D family protein [Methylibium sp.]